MRTHYHAETNRWWLYKANHRTLLNLEWQWLLKARFRLEIDFKHNWTVQSISIGLPYIFSVFINFGDADEWAAYELGCYWYQWAFWLNLFSNPCESNSGDPWYRKTHCFNLPDMLLGCSKCIKEVLSTEPVIIPMPERSYKGIATHERWTWKRPLWRTYTRESVWIDVADGIPFPGKGENSWDCGMDGLCGSGVDGTSVEKAIGHFVGCVLANRRKYGGKGWCLDVDAAPAPPEATP